MDKTSIGKAFEKHETLFYRVCSAVILVLSLRAGYRHLENPGPIETYFKIPALMIISISAFWMAVMNKSQLEKEIRESKKGKKS